MPQPLLREWYTIERPEKVGTIMKAGESKEPCEAGVDKVIGEG